MEKIFELATNIKTPLALGGFLAAIFFFIIKKILDKSLGDQISQDKTIILKKIINFSFVLAITAVILGSIGYISAFTDFNLKINHTHTIDTKPIHITVDVNVRVDRALDNFFDEIDKKDASLNP